MNTLRAIFLSLCAFAPLREAFAAATLEWDAADYYEGLGLTAGFHVYVGLTPRGPDDVRSSTNYTRMIDVGNTNAWALEGMIDGTNYMAVTAYDSNGVETPFSEEVWYCPSCTNQPPILPSAPSSIRLRTDGPVSSWWITLSLQMSTNAGVWMETGLQKSWMLPNDATRFYRTRLTLEPLP